MTSEAPWMDYDERLQRTNERIREVLTELAAKTKESSKENPNVVRETAFLQGRLHELYEQCSFYEAGIERMHG